MSKTYLSLEDEFNGKEIKKKLSLQLHVTFFENYLIEICKILKMPNVTHMVFRKYKDSNYSWDARYVACDIKSENETIVEGSGDWAVTYNVDIFVKNGLPIKEKIKLLNKAENHLAKARALLIFKGLNKEFFKQAWESSTWFQKKTPINLNNYQEMIGDLLMQPERVSFFQAKYLSESEPKTDKTTKKILL